MVRNILVFILVFINLTLISSGEILKKNILFHPDSDEILKKSVPDIDEIYDLLNKSKNYLITLKGFTNYTGNPEKELELSIRRSNAIALILNTKGISLKRIKTAGYGSLNLKVKKITEENRRVEVYVYKNEEEINKIEEIIKDTRKFKIIVTDSQDNYIYARVTVEDEIFNISGPRVIDIPAKNNLKFSVNSHGFIGQDFIIKSSEQSKTVKLTEILQQDYILIKGGTFKMGDEIGGGGKDEKPVHEVILDDYYIGKYEVTQAEWNKVMDYNPSITEGENIPVHNVTWYESVEYCNKRSIYEGLKPYYIIHKDKIDPNNKNNKSDKYKWYIEIDKSANGYRLPTEAEWEYAAKGGEKSNKYKYSGSDYINDAALYFMEKQLRLEKYPDKDLWFKHIVAYNVGKSKPNELNIYNMSDNVPEWCWDWYDNNYYKKSEKNNPNGSKKGVVKVLRGGLSRDFAFECRTSVRMNQRPYISSYKKTISEAWSVGNGYSHNIYYNYIGFRVVKNMK